MELNEADKITEALRQKTFDFLNGNHITMPIKVENSLNDVFDENDFTSDEDDVINIYFKEDLQDFLDDTKIIVQLNVQVRGGNSSGLILDKYSYYGVLQVDNAIQRNEALYDGETLVNQLINVEPTDTNKLEDPSDFCIVVIEEQEFHMGEYRVVPRLYMYVPQSGEGIM